MGAFGDAVVRILGHTTISGVKLADAEVQGAMDSTESPQTRALSMQLIDGASRRTILIERFPFVIGRLAECDLMLPESYISRSHARITREGEEVVLEDTNSSHGTFVNGERITRRSLRPQDSIRFGSLEGPELRFEADDRQGSTNLTILEQMQGIDAQPSDLEKLRWFLQAARDLNSAGRVDRVLASLLESTLALAKVERGYVFLANAKGVLEFALGMDAAGRVLTDTPTVSQTVMRQAIEGTDQFLVTDTLTAEGHVPASILAHNIRKIICIPLWQLRGSHRGDGAEDRASQVFGVLYLESRLRAERDSDVDHELMRTIAREAAALVDNAQLAAIEDQARQHKEELQIAARIQQGLMAVQIPAFPFADVQAHSVACSAVGGDFFDVVSGDDLLNVALVDVSGKGISAAILAATLQGMLYVQLQAQQPLEAIALATNRYLCQKNVGKYATMLLLRLHEDGTLEYMNCGHIQPRVCSDAGVSRLETANLPVGLIDAAEYKAGITRLRAGWRVVLATDGFTEAENPQGEFFGEERLDSAALCMELQPMLQGMADFCAGQPAGDDCTIVQVTYSGRVHGDAAVQPSGQGHSN
jgi:serine phosphatase RsbU (regulator of sigma subunit)/pSer/pThr/pTyr-binding forkhead associated (FHA) protein